MNPSDLVPSITDPNFVIEYAGISASGITVDSTGTVYFADDENVFRIDGNSSSFTTVLLASFSFAIDSLAVDSAGAIYALEGDRTSGIFEVHKIPAVPLPAAVWLFGSALGVFGLLRMRTKPNN